MGRTSESTVRYRAGKPRREEYLLVDGYNIIFAWEELRELAKENIHAACDKLMDILSNYQGYRISAMGLKKEIEDAEKAGKQEWKARRQSSKTYLFDQVSEELSARLEKVRMGQEEL